MKNVRKRSLAWALGMLMVIEFLSLYKCQYRQQTIHIRWTVVME